MPRLPSKPFIQFIDDVDRETIVSQFVHHLIENPRLVKMINAGGYVSIRATALVHRVLMSPPKGHTVDHINNLRHDNRRKNLRVSTYSQNNSNSVKPKRGGHRASLYRGVSLHKARRSETTIRWTANLRAHGKRIHLGYFKNQEDAARAYDAAALHHYGEFATLNFPESSE